MGEMKFFDPISKPKQLKSAQEMRELPEGQILTLGVGTHEVTKGRRKEEHSK